MNVYIKKQNFIFQKVLTRIIILVLVILLLNIFQLEIKNSFYHVSSPLINIFKSSGNNIYNFFQSSFNFNSLKKENDNLKEENQKLLSEISSLESLARENQSSKEALENARNRNFSILSSRIIQLDIANDYIVINKGSENGVKVNMPVVSSQEVIFGKVVKVYDNFSEVILISNKNSVLDSKIQYSDPTKQVIHGVVKGKGNLSVYLDLVKPDSEVNQGDILVTSGLEGNLPSGLIIGKILSVNNDDLKPFLTADVLPLFDVKSVDNVFIITKWKT